MLTAAASAAAVVVRHVQLAAIIASTFAVGTKTSVPVCIG
jgi:hypothetical protein